MNPQQRREKLATKPNLRLLWSVMLVLQSIGVLFVILALVSVLSGATQYAGPNNSSLVARFAPAILIITAALQVVILWALYNLTDWLRWVLWVGVALSLISFNPTSVVISVLEALAYMAIIKTAQEPSEPSAPTVLPPQQ